MILVDTSVWFASFLPSSPDHQRASRWLDVENEPLVVTDYIVDETLTLLSARGHRHRATQAGRTFFIEGAVVLHFVTRVEVRSAWQIFERFHDKEWSFTDCVSYVVMQSLGITTAASFDHHFKQFGTVSIVP